MHTLVDEEQMEIDSLTNIITSIEHIAGPARLCVLVADKSAVIEVRQIECFFFYNDTPALSFRPQADQT